MYTPSGPNHDVEILAVATTLNVLGLFAVLLRFSSKWLSQLGFHLEDWLLLAAWAIATTEGVTTVVAIKWGFGRHQSALAPEQLTIFGKYVLVVLICQPTTLALSKLSVLWLLQRVFITHVFRVTVYLLMAVVVAWYLSILFADIFVCTPVQSHWDPTMGGNCGNMPLLDVISPLPWILTDFAILAAPVPLVLKLHLPLYPKLGVLGVLLLGIATTVISCVRYSAMFFAEGDMPWSSTSAGLLTVAEAQSAVVCAALLASKDAFGRFGWRDCSATQEEMGSPPPSGWQSTVESPQALSRRSSQEQIGSQRRMRTLETCTEYDDEQVASPSDVEPPRHVVMDRDKGDRTAIDI